MTNRLRSTCAYGVCGLDQAPLTNDNYCQSIEVEFACMPVAVFKQQLGDYEAR